ncbi:hypothetical protein T02_5932, partial [Trichinella nativa]
MQVQQSVFSYVCVTEGATNVLEHKYSTYVSQCLPLRAQCLSFMQIGRNLNDNLKQLIMLGIERNQNLNDNVKQ